MGSAWDDLDVTGRDGQYSTTISDAWDLAVVPQGGAIAAAALRAMSAELGDPTQTLRTMTAIAAFGSPRRGFEFTELVMPAVDPPSALRGFRDPLPDDVVFEFDHDPRPFWDRIVEGRPAIGRAPWEPFEDGPAEVATWYRIDDPPLDPDGRLAAVGPVVLCDTMPGSVGQKVGPDAGSWFAPSVDYTIHLFRSASPGWLLAHQRARHAGDGYASVDTALWDPVDETLVAYATQVMVFAFGR